ERPVLDRELTRQAHDAGIERLVHELAGLRQQTVHGGHIDHRATTRIAQMGYRKTRRTEHRLETDVEAVVPGVFGDIYGINTRTTAAQWVRVIDEDVELAPEVHDFFDHRLDMIQVADVAFERFRRTTRGADGLHVARRAIGIDIRYQDA